MTEQRDAFLRLESDPQCWPDSLDDLKRWTVRFAVLCLFSNMMIAQTHASVAQRQLSLYTNVLRAELELVDAELVLSQNELQSLASLHQRGHASWLEARRQQLVVDVLMTRREQLQRLVATVDALHSQAAETCEPIFHATERGRMPYVELPVQADASRGNSVEATLKQMKESQHRLAQELQEASRVANTLRADDPWKQRFKDREALASSRCRLLDSQVELLDAISSHASEAAFEAATESVGQLRAASADALREHCELHGSIINYLVKDVKRDRNAIAAARDSIHASGAVGDELESIEARSYELAQQQALQARVCDWLNAQLPTLVKTSPNKTSPNKTSPNKTSPNKTSPNIAANETSLTGQIESEYFASEARFQCRVAELREQVLSETLSRLVDVARQMDARSHMETQSDLAKRFKQGRHQEIIEYQRRLGLVQFEIQTAAARLAVWNQADAAQIAVARLTVPLTLNQATAGVAQALAPSETVNVAAQVAQRFGNNQPLGNVVDWGTFLPPSRFRTGSLSDLLLSPADLESRVRINRTSEAARSTASARIGLHDWARNSRYDYGALYHSSTNKLPKHERAYPFGILRSDLRRHLNPGQPPWYIPGSPTNLRSRFSHRSR